MLVTAAEDNQVSMEFNLLIYYSGSQCKQEPESEEQIEVGLQRVDSMIFVSCKRVYSDILVSDIYTSIKLGGRIFKISAAEARTS